MTRVVLALALVLPLSFTAARSASAVPITVSFDPIRIQLGPSIISLNPVAAPFNTFDLTDGVASAEFYGQFIVQSLGTSGGGSGLVHLRPTLTVNGVAQTIDWSVQETSPFGGPAFAVLQASGPFTFDLGSTGIVTVNFLQAGPVPIPPSGASATSMVARFLLTAPIGPTEPSPVPEPTTLLLCASGLAIVVYRRRKS